jgi:hypothetical protein
VSRKWGPLAYTTFRVAPLFTIQHGQIKKFDGVTQRATYLPALRVGRLIASAALESRTCHPPV